MVRNEIITGCLILIMSAMGALSSSMAGVNPIFEIGGMDGEGIASSPGTEPGKVKNMATERTIQCRAPFSNFPSIISEGQRLVLFLDEVPKSTLYVQTVICLKNTSAPTDVSLVWNQKEIFRKKIYDPANVIDAVIPGSEIESNGNLLQIINDGPSPLVLKYVSITELKDYTAKRVSIGQSKPSLEISENNYCYDLYGMNSSKNAFGIFYDDTKGVREKTSVKDFNESKVSGLYHFGKLDGLSLAPEKQAKKMKSVLSGFLKWLSSGGTSIIVTEYSEAGFFMDYYGNPRAPYFAIERLSGLFDGNPRKMPINVTAAAKNVALENIEWMATLNGGRSVTILLSSTSRSAENVNIICVTPWSGKTRIETSSGFAAENCKMEAVPTIKKTEEEIDIRPVPGGGLFEKNFSFDSCLRIRLCSTGETPPTPASIFQGRMNTPSPKFNKTGMNVSQTHPSPNLPRQILRNLNGLLCAEGNIEVGTAEATRAPIENEGNLTPLDTTSIMLKISLANTKKSQMNSARIYIKQPGSEMGELSFWVFPRIEGNTAQKYIKFHVHCGDSFYSAELKSEKWQRVSMPLNKDKYLEYFEILAPDDGQADRKYSFEINGVTAISGTESKPSIVKTSLEPLQSNNFRLTLIGIPGRKFEYHHFSKKTIRPDTISCKIDTVNTVYLKDPQILIVSGCFPPYWTDNPASKSLAENDAVKVNNYKLSIFTVSFSTE